MRAEQFRVIFYILYYYILLMCKQLMDMVKKHIIITT